MTDSNLDRTWSSLIAMLDWLLSAIVEAADAHSHRGDPPAFAHRRLGRDRHRDGQRGRKLVPRLDSELAEHAGEVTLDRARRDEERLGDLPVAEALARELGDAALAGGQRVEPSEHDSSRPRSRGAKLGLGVFGEGPRAPAVGGIESLAEKFPRFGAAVAPPEQGAEVGERTCSLHVRIASLERVDCLAEQGRSTVAAGNDAGGTLRRSQCAGSAECRGELDLLVCEASRRLALAEREVGERRLRAPGEVARAD